MPAPVHRTMGPASVVRIPLTVCALFLAWTACATLYWSATADTVGAALVLVTAQIAGIVGFERSGLHRRLGQLPPRVRAATVGLTLATALPAIAVLA